MASIDSRIAREARLFKLEMDGVSARRLERLRSCLDDEVVNMLLRARSIQIQRSGAAEWLHGKKYDETFRDYGPEVKFRRVRRRIEVLLELCGGDTALFLREYTRALTRHFPIQSPGFQWAPRLAMTETGRRTIVHSWRRIKV